MFDGVGVDQLLIVAVLVSIVAFFYSNLGLGGGQLYVPIMDLFFAGFLMKSVVPLSLSFAFVTMLSSAYSHNRKHLVHFGVGLQLAAAGLAGVAGGVLFTSRLADEVVKGAFAAMLVIVATKMLHDIHAKKKEPISPSSGFGMWARATGAAVSVLTGFLVGGFGIGGGIVSVPLIIYVFRLEPRMAIGTSSFIGAILTPAAMIAYWAGSGPGTEIHWPIAALLAPVVLVFAILGSTWGLRTLKTKAVRTLFVCGVFLAAAEMIYSIIAG